MTGDQLRVLAVDLGATSVRVAAVDLAAERPDVEVLHRWPHAPVRAADGSLRWDWDRIVAEVARGLQMGLDDGPVASIGVDGWGVDYGLIGGDGELVSAPYSYRDDRTARWRRLADAIGPDVLYQTTGIQLMPINTIFQLAAHDREELDRAARLLLLPDLLVRWLTGFEGAERSNASTTALMDARTGKWAAQLVDAVGLHPRLLPTIVPAGTRVGEWHGVPVHTVGSHDTASAFVGVPGVPPAGTAIISSGTWVLVGAERRTPDTSERARVANFSNEAGALGGVRFLKNVMGLGMLEQLRSAWGDPPVGELIAAAGDVTGRVPIVDATDLRFVAPDDMEAEVRDAANLGSGAGRGDVVRCTLESIASAVAGIVDQLDHALGRPIAQIMVVGGGARIGLLNDLFAVHTGVPVVVGSPEATALGNAVVQGLPLGRFEDVTDARRWLAATGTRS